MLDREPVALGGAVVALVNALIAAALAFGWVATTEQAAAINAVAVALVAVVTGWQRSRVSPVPR